MAALESGHDGRDLGPPMLTAEGRWWSSRCHLLTKAPISWTSGGCWAVPTGPSVVFELPLMPRSVRDARDRIVQRVPARCSEPLNETVAMDWQRVSVWCPQIEDLFQPGD